MKETGALPEETDLVVQELRSISGVEYAAFLKEKESGLIRISLRAKRKGDVAVAQSLSIGKPSFCVRNSTPQVRDSFLK